MSDGPKYVICKRPDASNQLKRGVVYKVECKFDGAYAIVGVPSLWLPSHFKPVDLDADHDIQVGDTVRVMAGDENGRALYMCGEGLIYSQQLNVGDVRVVDQVVGASIYTDDGGCVNAAFVEKVDTDDGGEYSRENVQRCIREMNDTDDTPTDANRIHRLTLRQAELERELFDAADNLRKVHDELKSLGVDVEGVDHD
jgi:hypothetical protein